MLAQLAARSALLIAKGRAAAYVELPEVVKLLAVRQRSPPKVPFGLGRSGNIGCRTGLELAHAGVGAQHDPGAGRGP
jgi:hypothetical protein